MDSIFEFPPFPGFRPEAFQFFRDLKEHNDREWFKSHKGIYDDEVQWPFQCLIADAARHFAEERLPLTGHPKQSLFKIHRDVRFSKNKAPYKTHAGGVLSRDGSREGHGALYIHFDPGSCMLASGFWMPEKEFVRAWRQHMLQDEDGFLQVVQALDTTGLKIESDAYLKRMPQGMQDQEDSPVAPWLKFKSYWVSRPFPDEKVAHPEFTHELVRMVRDSMPLLEYGWQLPSV